MISIDLDNLIASQTTHEFNVGNSLDLDNESLESSQLAFSGPLH